MTYKLRVDAVIRPGSGSAGLIVAGPAPDQDLRPLARNPAASSGRRPRSASTGQTNGPVWLAAVRPAWCSGDRCLDLRSGGWRPAAVTGRMNRGGAYGGQ